MNNLELCQDICDKLSDLESKNNIQMLIDNYKKICEENQVLKRRNFGLETTCNNLREKEYKRYAQYGRNKNWKW